MTELHRIAKMCDDIAASNGFDPPTWENLPVKLAMVVTEMDEARDGVYGHGEDPLEEELADIAIRILSALHAIWGRTWGDRVTGSRMGRPKGAFQPIEVSLWPVLGHVSKAIEQWRFERRIEVRLHLELALLQLWKLSNDLSIDLLSQIFAKMEKNRRRDKLHGKTRSEA